MSVAQRTPNVPKSVRQHDNLLSRMGRPVRRLLLPLEPLIDVSPLECGVLQAKGRLDRDSIRCGNMDCGVDMAAGNNAGMRHRAYEGIMDCGGVRGWLSPM